MDMRLDGLAAEQRRRLLLVVAISLGAFVIEMGAGQAAGSQALKADALDFLALAAGYAFGLWAVGKTADLRAGVALVKAVLLGTIGAWIGLTTLYQFLTHGVPEPVLMATVGFVALAANGLSLYLLLGRKPLRGAWLAVRNDMLGNVTVLVAAGVVMLLESNAADLIVAGVMVALFLNGAYQALREAWQGWEESRIAAAGPGMPTAVATQPSKEKAT